jgi:ATP-dependent helicase HrpA
MGPVTIDDLRARARDLPSRERQRFRRRLAGAERIAAPERREAIVASIAADLQVAEERLAARRRSAPDRFSYPEDLPITAHREELLSTIEGNRVVIVAGETGSGKSTQLPKMCLELGRGVDGMIGHTQPRRIAARSIAERVAEELGGPVGTTVGYTVRFADHVGPDTLVKVMTDGILLAEIHRDRRLAAYDTIILDEAHERSLNIDFLLGYLTTLLDRRRDLKLIVTSATIDTDRFRHHFGGAPVVEVSGRTYPVEIRYRPLDDPEIGPRDQPQAIGDAVLELAGEGRGDVLVFCAGEREIRDAAEAIGKLELPHTEILPLFGRLSAAEQHRVFQPHTGRRIVVATNVAETSLTVPGIRYVVDAGTARISRYSRRTKVQRLPIEAVSQASADQRAGRCGRLGPGICIRLYDEDDYARRPAFTEPEILRTNLASVILQMAALDLGEVESFPFLDPPDSRAIRDGIALLHELGAIDPDHEGTPRQLTDLGRRLARIPLDPRIGRMVLAGDAGGCLSEVLIIAAALTIPDPRDRPLDKEAQADQLHARFRDPTSDLMGWLNLWSYIRGERRERTSGQFRKMCREEFLNYRRLREWQDLHAQLREIVDELGMIPNRRPAEPDQIHRALLTGLLSHVGHKDPEGFEYRGARGARFSIAPGSALFKKSPPWIMAADLVETTRTWARGVAPVPVAWIEDLGAHLLQRSYGDPRWDRELGAAVADETVSLYGVPLVTGRTVLYGRIDPAAARELLIRHALIAGEWEAPWGFVERNRSAIAEVLDLEARERRTDILIDDDTLAAFFDRKLPLEISSVASFDHWWKEARGQDPHLLDLGVGDLIDPRAAPSDPEAFPEVWRHGDLAFPVDYEFDPHSPTDGVTIDVPLADVPRIDPTVFEWNVPGRRAELIEAMVRALPKQIRRRFVPIADTVAAVQNALDPAKDDLVHGLRRELSRLGGIVVPPEALDRDAIPPHLRPRFRVIADDGSVVAESDDLAALKAETADMIRSTIAAGRHPLEQSGLTAWSIGELPRTVEVGPAGEEVAAYPALIDDGETVSVRLLATPAEQEAEMRLGVARLLLLSLPQPAGPLRSMLDSEARQALGAGPYESASEWIDDCLMAAAVHLVDEAGGPPWDGRGFDRLRALARDELPASVMTVGSESLAALHALTATEHLLGPIADRHPDVVDDVVAQANRLVYPGFLTGVGASRVADVHRYLEAMVRRVERLPEHPERDAEMMARVRRLEEEHDRLVETLPTTPELIEVAWMLEELRVSFFAQQLGTRGKVSEARIERALADLLA